MAEVAAMSLREFVDYFLQQKMGDLMPIEIYNYGQAITMILYRQPPFQVELVIVLAGGGFPEEHGHPNVDSYEIMFVGRVPLTVSGKIPHRERVPRPSGGFPTFGISIPQNVLHGATHVRKNCAFLSIQRWRDGVQPTSVALDWDGSPISTEHAAHLQAPQAK